MNNPFTTRRLRGTAVALTATAASLVRGHSGITPTLSHALQGFSTTVPTAQISRLLQRLRDDPGVLRIDPDRLDPGPWAAARRGQHQPRQRRL